MSRSANDKIAFRVAQGLKENWTHEAQKDERTLSQWIIRMVKYGQQCQEQRGGKVGIKR